MIKKYIISGDTGSGKTYNSINWARKMGRFIYAAPCRQLTYETFIDYSEIKDSLKSGEVNIIGSAFGNLFAVYENLMHEDINIYKTLIIDEAHFITDYQRGGVLKDIIKRFTGNIFLVTATPTFDIEGFKNLYFFSENKRPKIKFINHYEFCSRIREGIPSIAFCMYSSDAMINADTLPSDRLLTQLQFREGKINYLSATNILAQGINLPAENIYVEYNKFDSREIIVQKIGRAGRRGFSNAKEVTVCLEYRDSKIPPIKDKSIINVFSFSYEEELIIDSFLGMFKCKVQEDLIRPWWLDEIQNNNFDPQYRDVKYSKNLILQYYKIKDELSISEKNYILKCKKLLDDEADKLKKIILSNRRGEKVNLNFKLKRFSTITYK